MVSPASILTLSQAHHPWLCHLSLTCDFKTSFNRIIKIHLMRTMPSYPRHPLYIIFTSQEIFSAISEGFHCPKFNIFVDSRLCKTNTQPSF